MRESYPLPLHASWLLPGFFPLDPSWEDDRVCEKFSSFIASFPPGFLPLNSSREDPRMRESHPLPSRAS